MNYETLDMIADLYNPVLFFLYILFAVIYWRSNDKLASLKGFFGILFCYILLFADHLLGLWKSFELDYSTHTAVAFSLVYFHLHKRNLKQPAAIAFCISLAGYYILMLYQQYHTVADMLTTLIVVIPAVLAIYSGLKKLAD